MKKKPRRFSQHRTTQPVVCPCIIVINACRREWRVKFMHECEPTKEKCVWGEYFIEQAPFQARSQASASSAAVINDDEMHFMFYRVILVVVEEEHFLYFFIPYSNKGYFQTYDSLFFPRPCHRKHNLFQKNLGSSLLFSLNGSNTHFAIPISKWNLGCTPISLSCRNFS